MGLNLPATHRQRRRLNRRPFSSEQPFGFRFCQVPLADLSNGQAISFTLLFVGGVNTLRDLAKLDPGFVTRLLDGHHAEPAKHHSTPSPLGIAILENERFGPCALDLTSKAAQLSVPDEDRAASHWLRVSDDAFGQALRIGHFQILLAGKW